LPCLALPCSGGVGWGNASIHRSAFKEKRADWQQRGVRLHFFDRLTARS